MVSKVAVYDLDTSISIGGAELYCLMTRTSLVGVLAGSVGVGSTGVLVGTTIVGGLVAVSSLHPPTKGNNNSISVSIIQNCRICLFWIGGRFSMSANPCNVFAPCL